MLIKQKEASAHVIRGRVLGQFWVRQRALAGVGVELQLTAVALHPTGVGGNRRRLACD